MSQHLLRGVVPDFTPPDDYFARWAFPYYAALTPEEERLAVLLGSYDLLLKGITMVGEAGTVRHASAAADAVRQSGIRCELGTWAWDLVDDFDALRWTTAEAVEVVDSLFAQVAAAGCDRLTASASVIGMGTCSDELLQEARAVARRHDAMLNLHQSVSESELEHHDARGLGVPPLVHFDGLGVLDASTRLVHLTMVDDDELALLAERDARVVHCDLALLKMGAGALRFSRVPEMVEHGITVAIGTDTVNVSNTNDVLRAAHTTALVFKHAREDLTTLPAEQALEMCTIAAARALGVDDRLGSLEPGKQADVAIFDATRPEWVPLLDVVNNLIYSADGDSVDTVIVGGKVVVEGGRLPDVDLGALAAEAQQASRDVLERAGVAAAPRWPVVD
jgi:cytosine/adenosine deaminase-related metal-dependent hydrolase